MTVGICLSLSRIVYDITLTENNRSTHILLNEMHEHASCFELFILEQFECINNNLLKHEFVIVHITITSLLTALLMAGNRKFPPESISRCDSGDP